MVAPRRRFAFRSPSPRSGGLLVARPVLSIAMPTRNRPELLERALRSLVTAMAPVAEHVEITVSDGSDADASGRVVERYSALGRAATATSGTVLP